MIDDIKVLIDDALKLGTDNEHGHDYKKDFETRYLLKTRNPTRTGWDYIDKISKNGLGKGELGVCIAPTESGGVYGVEKLDAPWAPGWPTGWTAPGYVCMTAEELPRMALLFLRIMTTAAAMAASRPLLPDRSRQ